MITAKESRKLTNEKIKISVGELIGLLYQRFKVELLIKEAARNGKSQILVSKNLNPAIIMFLEDKENGYKVEETLKGHPELGYRISW